MKSATPIVKVEEQSYSNAEPAQFVSCLDAFNEVIPDCDAVRRFRENPTWCLSNNQRGLRCHSQIPFQARHEITQLLVELAELNIYSNVQECLGKLSAFTSIAVCTWQRGAVKTKLESLLRTYRSRSFPQVTLTNPGLHTERGRIVGRSPSALMKRGSGLNPVQMEEREIENPLKNPAVKVTYWLRKSSSQALQYLPEYHPYHSSELCPKRCRERSAWEWVVEQANEPLFIPGPRVPGELQGLDERKDGYLYVYWNRASFGLVKIGRTTVNVDKRLQQWEEKCKQLVEEHYRSSYKIKHVARVEKLIHAEFREYRVFEPYCRGCGHVHIEWFRGLDLGLVIKKIEAWTEWVMKAPYEERLGVWRLKDGPEFELPPQICATPSEPNSPKKRVTSTVKESPRYHLRRCRTPGLSQDPPSPTRS